MHQNCSRAVMPLSNKEYWSNKLLRNQERDRENQQRLRILGWKVILIWECELKRKNREVKLARIEQSIIEQ